MGWFSEGPGAPALSASDLQAGCSHGRGQPMKTASSQRSWRPQAASVPPHIGLTSVWSGGGTLSLGGHGCHSGAPGTGSSAVEWALSGLSRSHPEPGSGLTDPTHKGPWGGLLVTPVSRRPGCAGWSSQEPSEPAMVPGCAGRLTISEAPLHRL